MGPRFGFSPRESRILLRLSSPPGIQRYLDEIDYNLEEEGETFYSPRRVLRERKASCVEGAVFAAAALRFHGRPPLIVDLTSVRDDDHVVAAFKQYGRWGAIAKSKYTGLRYREPIHLTIRELALTFFEDYFNTRGEKTLRAYSRPVDLSRFDKLGWMTSEEDLFFIGDYLEKVTHYRLLTGRMVKNLSRVTPIAKEAGELWISKMGLSSNAIPRR